MRIRFRRGELLFGLLGLLVGSVMLTLLVGPSAASTGTTVRHDVEVSPAVRHDLSPPLRDLHSSGSASGNAHPALPLPVGPSASEGTETSGSAAPLGALSVTNGLGSGTATTDSRPTARRRIRIWRWGATQVVQWVNESFAVFDKTTGALVAGPTRGNAIWSGFGGGCESNNDGDPIVQYDKAAQRWILTQFSVSTTPYLQCVAVSTTSDATGSYNRYAFQYDQFPDYPKLSVWPDAYYITFNMFTSTFQGARVCAYDRAAMLAGGTATQQCFQLSSSFGGLLPSDQDGATAPPAGSPNYLLNFGTNSLNLWKFHVDWTQPANTILTGPTNIPVAAFTLPCRGKAGACVPQPGTRQQLDTLGDRLMYRLAYRNFGDHEALVVNHSVGLGKGKNTTVGVRWYELRSTPPGSGTFGVLPPPRR
jgi:hypothetical protein